MVATKSRILVALAVVGIAAACEQADPIVPADDAPVLAAAVTLPTAAVPNEVWVCKDAPAGSFSFTVSLSQAGSGATVHDANPTIAADACTKVASGAGAFAHVTESDPSPYIFEKIEVYEIPLNQPTQRNLIATDLTNDGSGVQYGDRGIIFVFYNVSPPSTGCTLTQGYWKTHSEYGPAGPYDATWAMLAGGADEPFFLSGMSWYEVFWTPVGGNAYYNLAHQYMAAKLNVLAGADPTAVATELAAAEAFFAAYTPAYIGSLENKNSLVKDAKNLASTLDDYNNGLIGPGHCSDVPTDI